MSVRTGSGAWKLLVDSLGVHRRVTGSAGFDPRRKHWTVILRQVPRSALMAPVRMLHDDTGNGENGQKPILHSLRPRALQRSAHGSALFCLLDGPAELALEGLNIEELSVVNGADRLFSCLDKRFPDLETHEKIGESLDDVFRLKGGKGERTAAYTGRFRELFEKAAREGIELPDVARGYLMLRGARLGPERKAIVLAALQERNVAQALRSTFPINLGVTKEFVHVMDDCDEPLMPLEEQSTSEVDSGEIDALITNFETLSNTTEESCPIDEEEAVRTLVTWKESRQNLNVVKRDRNFSQNSNSQTPVPDIERIRRRTRCFRCRRIGHFSKDCPERLQKKPVSQAKVLVTRDDLSARRQTKTLDELLLEIEQLSQERASHVSVEPDDEEETCLLLHEPGNAIIDTGCGRCVIGRTDAGSSSVCDGRSGKRDCLAL